MITHNITIESGTSKRLPTSGKYCDRDIIITAEGGGGGGDDVIASILSGTILEINNPSVTSLKSYGLSNLSQTTSIRLDNLTTTQTCAFRNDSALQSIYLPKLKTVGTYGFADCDALTNVYVPELTAVTAYCFQSDGALETLDLPKVTSIAANAFKDTALTTLILRSTSKKSTLAAASALTNTPIAAGTGYIYVPSALVDEYKNYSNWVTYSSQIRAIEDYPEITGG